MPDPTSNNVPIETRPTPEVLDTLFYEFVDVGPAEEVRTPYGSEHPQTGKYPGFKLVKEERISYDRVQRWYSNDPVNPDTWAYSIEYSGDSNSHQIFARRYLYRRDAYAVAGPIAKQSLFTGVYLIRVTDGGENYDEPPTVTGSGGGGTGATFRAIINKSGEVVWVVVVTEGTGYTTAPALAFAGGGGTGATATAYVQPAACYLVAEKASELGADDPRQSLYIAVVRIYEVLPGPWLPFTRYDLLLGPIQGRKRAVLNTSQAPALTATTKTTYEARDGSAIVSLEIEETNSDGSGGAGNPAFPIGTRDYYDAEKGAVQEVTQVVVATGAEVGSIAIAAGVVTEIRYEPVNQFLLKKITETWAIPGPETSEPGYDKTGTAIRRWKQLVTLASGPPGAIGGTLNGQTIVDATYEPLNAFYGRLVRDTKLLIPGETVTSRTWAKGGLQKKIERTPVIPSAALTLPGAAGGAGENILSEHIETVGGAESARIKETLLTATGAAIAAGVAGEWTIGSRDGIRQVTLYTTFYPIAPYVPGVGSDLLPIENSVFKTGRVTEAERRSIEDSPWDLAVVEWCAKPPARVSYPDDTFTFPGILVVINDDWWNSTNTPGFLRHPWIGVDIEQRRPVTKAITAREITFYTIGPLVVLPNKFNVTTPGTYSGSYEIIHPSIHPPILIEALDLATGEQVTIEDIPGSSPSSYDPFDILIAAVSSRPWKGRYYEVTIREVSERTNPQNFPPFYFLTPFLASSAVDLVKRMDSLGYGDDGTRLIFYSDGADSRTVTIHGKGVHTPGDEPIQRTETITLTGATRVASVRIWFKVHQISLSTTSATRTVLAVGESAAHSGSVLFTGRPASAETFTITRNGTPKVFTFRRPEWTRITIGPKTGLNTTAVAADYVMVWRLAADQVTIESVVFWLDTDGLVTAPGVGTREIKVDIQSVSLLDTAAVQAAAITAKLKAAMILDGGWFVYQYTGITDVLEVLDRHMGARATDATLSGGIPAPWAIVTAEQGTAQAANDIRILPSSDGVDQTNQENPKALAAALTNDAGDIGNAIIAGQIGVGTVALTYEFDANGTDTEDTVVLTSDETIDPLSETWILATTAATLTLDSIDNGADGETVATFAPNTQRAFPDVDFFNPKLDDINVPWGEIITTDGLATGNKAVILYLKAHGKPGIPVKYQVSDTGVLADYVDGATAIKNLQGKRGQALVRQITPELTYAAGTKAVNFIRLVFDLSGTSFREARAVHAVMLTDATS